MRVTDYLYKDPDEYEDWEYKDGQLRWEYDVHKALQYRLYEVEVEAEVDEVTGEYTVIAFVLDKERFTP